MRIWFQCGDYADVCVTLAIDWSTFLSLSSQGSRNTAAQVTKHSCANATPSQRNRECNHEVNTVSRWFVVTGITHSFICINTVYILTYVSQSFASRYRDKSNFIDDLLFMTYVLTCIKLSKSWLQGYQWPWYMWALRTIPHNQVWLWPHQAGLWSLLQTLLHDLSTPP